MNDSNNTGKKDIRSFISEEMTPAQCFEYVKMRLNESEVLLDDARRLNDVELTGRAGRSVEFWEEKKKEYEKGALAEKLDAMNEVKKSWTRGHAV